MKRDLILGLLAVMGAGLFLVALFVAVLAVGGYGIYLLLTPFHLTYLASCKIALGTLITYFFARIVRDN